MPRFPAPCYDVVIAFVETRSLDIPSLFAQLTGVLFPTVDRSGTGQSGSSPRVTLRLNQVRGARDEKKGGSTSNSRQGGMSAQVHMSTTAKFNLSRTRTEVK